MLNKEGDMKGVIAVLVVVGLFIGWLCYCNRPNNGIYALTENIVLIKGDRIVISWEARESEWVQAFELWKRIK
jgi:hypothetical protein